MVKSRCNGYISPKKVGIPKRNSQFGTDGVIISTNSKWILPGPKLDGTR